jgi:IclR family acetate operon transcriptional repressor
MADPTPLPVKSAMRTLDIIEYVVARDRAVVAQEISSALTIPVSSLSYLLNTLVERGYLARDGRRYTAGPGLERLHARSHDFSIADRAAPLVRSLRLQLNETVSFFVRRGWEMEAIVTESSDHALRYAVRTATITPLYCYSAGKALLATLGDADLERYLADVPRPALTPTTITDAELLRHEIAEIRRTGIARTREESTPGIQGVGRAVIIDGDAVGAFAIAIPSARFDVDMEQRVIELLVTTSALLSR